MSNDTTQKTRTVRAGLETDTQYGAVVPPIHLTSTFAFSGFGEKRTYDYSRSGNPTRDLLGGALADLEGGAGAVVTASGMAAVTLVTQLFRPGQVAVVPHDCYGGTYRLFNALRERGSLDVRFVDFQDAAALAGGAGRAARAGVDRDAQQSAAADHGHRAGGCCRARRGRAGRCRQHVPVAGVAAAAGARAPTSVVHSTTKYLNGHSDVVGGAVIAQGPTCTSSCLVGQLPRHHRRAVRQLPDAARPAHAARAHAGTRREHAGRSSSCSQRHPAVKRVYYPGLAVASRARDCAGASSRASARW